MQIPYTFLNMLSWMLIHSLWQICLVACTVYILLRLIRHTQVHLRYLIALCGLITIPLLSLGTIFYLLKSPVVIHSDTIQVSSIQEDNLFYLGPNTFIETAKYFTEVHSLWIVLLWIIGIMIISLRLIGGLYYVQYLKTSFTPISWQELYTHASQNLIERINAHNVRIGVHPDITTPLLIGYIKPIILLPLGLLNHLNPQEIDMILAHEYGHFFRRDTWMLMLQNIIETIFYYHPAVWWLSSIVHEERECACDKLTLKWTGQKSGNYATLLIKIQELYTVNKPQWSLAAVDNNTSFYNRIKRILNMKTQLISIKPKLLIFSILMLCIGVLMASNWSRLEQKIGFKPEFTELPYTSDFNHQHINNDTLPSSYAQQKTIIKKMDGNRSYSIEMENGIIKELEVDGKKINPEEYDQYSDIIEESSPKTGKNGGQMYFFGSPNQDFEQIFEFDNFNFDSIQGRFFGNGFDKKSIEEMQQELLNMQEKMKDFPMQFNFKFLDSMGSQDFVFPDFEEFFRSGESFGMGDKRFEFVYPDGDSGQNNGDRFWKSQDRIQDKMNINNIIGNALNDDGFLIPNQNNVVELTGKYLKINGEKQPTNIWNKYKMIFESETGTRLEKNSKIKFQIVGKQSKRKYKIY